MVSKTRKPTEKHAGARVLWLRSVTINTKKATQKMHRKLLESEALIVLLNKFTIASGLISMRGA